MTRFWPSAQRAADIELVDGFLDLQFEADPSAGALVCAADSGSANLTGFQERAYRAVLLLRRIGFTRQLPWTDLALFDWFVEAIDGIRFKSDFPGFGYCCTPSRYMWINPSVMPDTDHLDRFRSPRYGKLRASSCP